jgi:hypothetical protein
MAMSEANSRSRPISPSANTAASSQPAAVPHEASDAGRSLLFHDDLLTKLGMRQSDAQPHLRARGSAFANREGVGAPRDDGEARAEAVGSGCREAAVVVDDDDLYRA